MERFRRTGLVAAGVAVLLTSCASSPPTNAWVISPIEYDNSIGGGTGRNMIDVTYPMTHIEGDSVGGFWTESAGSWLRIDEDDATIRRFNLEGEKRLLRVRGVAALDSTTFIVSGYLEGLWLFDTATMTWTPTPADASVMGDVVGDVAVAEGTVFYVENLYDAVGNAGFVVRRLDDSAVDPIVTPQIDVRDGEAVSLSVGDDMSIIANTGSRLYEINPAGEASLLAELPGGTPVSALSPSGTIAWATAPSITDESWYVDGGSSDARRVIEGHSSCDARSIETSRGEVSPPLCNIRALNWIDAHTLIVSAGTENGAVLARIRTP